MTPVMMRHAVVQGSRTVEFHKSQDACRRSRVLMFHLFDEFAFSAEASGPCAWHAPVGVLHRPTQCPGPGPKLRE